MMNKKRLYALAVMPVLSLFALEALAGKVDPADQYANSFEGGIPESGVIKKCTVGTLFKNVDPFISGGNPDAFPVERSLIFLIDGNEVELVVTWDADNSFSYDFGESGQAVMNEIGVENNSDKIIYKYDSPKESDSGMNKLKVIPPAVEAETADKANHLDICISPRDSSDPDVSDIRLEPYGEYVDGVFTFLGEVNGTTVSGKVNIIAEVSDESDVDFVITIEAADGTDVTPAFSAPTTADCQIVSPDCTEYTWGPWDTTLVPPGEYIITLVVTDTSVFTQPTTVWVDVTVSVANCLEGADGIPDNQIGVGGCNPSGFQIVELPNELEGYLDGKTLTQVAAPAIYFSGVCNAEFVAQDPRVDEDGNLIGGASYPLDLSDVFDLSAFFPGATGPDDSVLDGQVVMRADTVGSPCLTLIFGDANFSFAEFYDPNLGQPLFGTGAYNYAVTQFPEYVPGMYTLPEVGDLSASQDDLQFVPQATYQTDNRFFLVEEHASPFTSDNINPSRKLSPEFSWFGLNTREVCLTLDPGLPYGEAVLQCKIDLAVEYFDNLEQAVIEAGPNLLDPTLNNLLTDVNKARSMVKVGFWDKANTDLTALYNQVVNGNWIVDERNDPGNLIMRIQNLFFRIEQLEFAESLLQ